MSTICPPFFKVSIELRFQCSLEAEINRDKFFTFLHVASELFLYGDLTLECNFFFPLTTVATVIDTFPMTSQQRLRIFYKREKKKATPSIETFCILCLFSISF